MKKILLALVSAWCACAFADADADLRAAQARERAGQKAEAAAGYAGVFANDKLPKHQRLAALCGLLRTDDARRVSLGSDGLKSSDAEWSGTVAQAIASLPAPALDAARAAWLKTLPGDAQVKLVTALAHVRSPAAKGYIQDILKKTDFPAVRLVALEGLGRTGGAEDAKKLVIWMHSEDPGVSAAARRGLILLTDARTNLVLADELKNYGKDPAFLAKLLDVLTVRNPLGLGGAIAPYLAHADADVRVQAYRALALQGMAPEMPAVLAAAGKATDKKERKEARRAVARIARRMGGVQFKARRIAHRPPHGRRAVQGAPHRQLPHRGVRRGGLQRRRQARRRRRPVSLPRPRLQGAQGARGQERREGGRQGLRARLHEPAARRERRRQARRGERQLVLEGDVVDREPPAHGRHLDPAPDRADRQHRDRHPRGHRRRRQGDRLPARHAGHLPLPAWKGRPRTVHARFRLQRPLRNDVLTPVAWYEHLADGGWKKHPLNIGFQGGRLGHASNLIVFDVNKDGLADIIVSSAHKYGIFWWEQLKERDAAGEIQFRKHVIDDTWTQAHYLGWGDIDNDGVPELVTGKRFMAHNGGDPDEYGPLGIYYYDFTPGPNPVFKKYVISYDSDISVGLNVECVDIDGDGDLDLVTTGKYGGPVILENKLK